MEIDKNILAFEYYGTEIGRPYFESDLETEEQVEILFDLAQVLRAHITGLGWQHLFKTFGVGKLYETDLKSGWFDTEDKSDWIAVLTYTSLCCGYYPLKDALGKWDESTDTFKTETRLYKVDWTVIRNVSAEIKWKK